MRKFLAPPYNSQRAVFASPLSAFFSFVVADAQTMELIYVYHVIEAVDKANYRVEIT